jgi:hypothetical protein
MSDLTGLRELGNKYLCARDAVLEIERLRKDCRILEMAAADANALVLQHETVIERLRDVIFDARVVIKRGVELMTNEQVGHWEGVRTWLEQEAK